jgi:hypothetical protein
MASVFSVHGRPTSEGISKRILLTSSTYVLWKESLGIRGLLHSEYLGIWWLSHSEFLGIRGLSHSEFTEILFHQSMDELRKRSRQWGRIS